MSNIEILLQVLSDAEQTDISIDKDMSTEYLKALYYAVDKGYLIVKNKNYCLSSLGRDFLSNPNRTPIINHSEPHIKNNHIGTPGSKSFWKNEFIIFVIYPLLVALISTLILKLFSII